MLWRGLVEQKCPSGGKVEQFASLAAVCHAFHKEVRFSRQDLSGQRTPLNGCSLRDRAGQRFASCGTAPQAAQGQSSAGGDAGVTEADSEP